MERKNGRPFYELPSHIKPCSKIIQETRLQLKYAKTPPSSKTTPPEPEGPLPLGVKAVNTQRPFTPRDTVSLWGMHARKRPPSAITLSRLSLPIEEEWAETFGNISQVSKASSGRRSYESHSLEGIEEAGDFVTEQIKSLSLQSSKGSSAAVATLGSIYGTTDNGRTKKARQAEAGDGDDFQHINNLEVAIEYLKSFVAEYSTTSERPPKSQVISILKIIHGMVREGQSSPQLRRKLLELIFKLVERNQNDQDILFWASFVLLHCNIIGNNLTTVFKMVFKSSRSKDYKEIILGTEYLEVLLKSLSQICPKTQTESMIYGYGTLKFICGDANLLNRVIDLNLVQIMALHLKILNCENELTGGGKVPEGILNGTFQLTSILRSVVGEERTLMGVVESGLLQQLCNALPWAMIDGDVLTNIVRILSVVSMDSYCCGVIGRNASFCSSVVRILKEYYASPEVIVRLAYCLGNLLANSDDMRLKLFEEPGAFLCILKLMGHYLDLHNNPATIDILIKGTRVLANWILNPFVGSEICDEPSLSNILFRTLKEVGESSQELSLCVLCALNNTSFYINYNELDEGTMRTAEYLFTNLPKQSLEVRGEGVKVLGNLTRNENVKLMAANYIENILSSLDETDAPGELLCASCGVLINVVIEDNVKAQFLKQGGVNRLMRLLERTDDVMVSLITSQVIWNLLVSHQGSPLDLVISPEQRVGLRELLLEQMQGLGGSCDRGSCEHEDQIECQGNQIVAEDFILVAKDLVAKLA